MADLDEAEGIKQCPWCHRYCAKDDNCNWVCCGLASNNVFYVGCGHQWCFQCGKRLCGQLFRPATKARIPHVPTSHSELCGCKNDGTYCEGGHNSHAAPRWRE